LPGCDGAQEGERYDKSLIFHFTPYSFFAIPSYLQVPAVSIFAAESTLASSAATNVSWAMQGRIILSDSVDCFGDMRFNLIAFYWLLKQRTKHSSAVTSVGTWQRARSLRCYGPFTRRIDVVALGRDRLILFFRENWLSSDTSSA
jgi:hypothetical protein